MTLKNVTPSRVAQSPALRLVILTLSLHVPYTVLNNILLLITRSRLSITQANCFLIILIRVPSRMPHPPL